MLRFLRALAATTLCLGPVLAADYSELDALLARLDSTEVSAEIALAGRRTADAHALADSARAGGGGLAEPVPVVAVEDLQGDQAPVATLPVAAGGTALVAAQAGDPTVRMQEILDGLGLVEGEQALPDGQIGLVVVSPPIKVQVAPGQPGAVSARSIAYHVADLSARARLVEFLGVDVALERSFEKERFQAIKQANPGLEVDQAAAVAAEAVPATALDQMLAQLGLGTDGDEAEKRKALTQHYRSEARKGGQARVSGCATLAVAEGPVDGDHCLVVALIWSPTLATLTNRALTPAWAARPIPPGSRTAAMERLPLRNPLQMARQFGAQMVSDGAGNQWIVGYGQAEYEDADDYDLAVDEADLEALAAITVFVSSRVETESTRAQSQLMEQAAEGQLTVTQVREHRKRVAETSRLRLVGAATASTARAIIDGRKVAIVAKMWSPNSAAFARWLGQVMASGATPGGLRPTPAPAPAPAPEGGQSTPGNSTTTDF